MKNKLPDLNNHLFAQLERLGDEDLKGEKLQAEINRSKAISSVSAQIINGASLALRAQNMLHEKEISHLPEVIGGTPQKAIGVLVMARFIYSREMLNFLRANYPHNRINALTIIFNERFGLQKTPVQIKSVVSKNKMQSKRPPGFARGEIPLKHTPEQIEWLKYAYPLLSLDELTADFNHRYGKSESVNQMRAFLKNHGITSGRSGLFKKGHVSWNKGKKGMRVSPATEFKPGRESLNKRPVGSERICSKDGYVLIKVAEPNKWRLKQMIVWEQLHGPIPKGHILRFRDTDKTNITEENLVLITRAEHAILNKLGIQGLPKELEPTIKNLIKVKRSAAAAQKRQPKRAYRKSTEKSDDTRT